MRVNSRALAAVVRGRASRLRADLDNARDVQQCVLMDLLAAHASTAFGREHGYASIRSVAEFRRRVPVASYDAMAPWIARAVAGEADVLFPGVPIACEFTGGSTSGARAVAYSADSLREFRHAALPWLDDLFVSQPGLVDLAAYWSISPARRVAPAADAMRIAVPVGVSDGAYLGEKAGAALLASLAVPPQAAAIGDIDTWRRTTLVHLLASRSLGLVSVWSPTFMLELLRLLDEAGGALVDDVARIDARRAREVVAALDGGRFDLAALWPSLRVVSCWADAASAAPAARLAARLPGAVLQGKGLLATEGAVTIPLSLLDDPVVCPRSGFFEFADAAGGVAGIEALQPGAPYDVLLTNASGLVRYRLGDRVECTGYAGQAPMLRFVGRSGRTSDLVGEKLDEPFVTQALAALRGHVLVRDAVAILAARPGAATDSRTGCRAAYRLLVEGDPATGVPAGFAADARIVAALDDRLSRNPQYAYARSLGQLDAPAVEWVPRLTSRWVEARRRAGQSIGDIKLAALIDASEAKTLCDVDPRAG